MRKPFRARWLGPLLIILIGAAPVDPALEAVGRVIQRTKTTRATYAIYARTYVPLTVNEPVHEWSAEFHQIVSHRVETPRDRVIADCATMTGADFSLVTGQIDRRPGLARTACGISTEGPVTEVESVGRFPSTWGPVDRVVLYNSQLRRTYDVTTDGIIVAETFETPDDSRRLILRMEALAVARRLPRSDIFSEASLVETAVPEQYRRPWSGTLPQ